MHKRALLSAPILAASLLLSALPAPASAMPVAAAAAVAATSAVAGKKAKTDKKAPELKAADPLAGDAWHAVSPSWPGTMRFDGKAHTVRLEPLGSAVIDAAYEVSELKETKGQVAGRLKMTATTGEVSESTFEIADKRLTLQFVGGPNQEHYERLTPEEAQAQVQKLRDAIKAGKLKVPTTPVR